MCTVLLLDICWCRPTEELYIFRPMIAYYSDWCWHRCLILCVVQEVSFSGVGGQPVISMAGDDLKQYQALTFGSCGLALPFNILMKYIILFVIRRYKVNTYAAMLTKFTRLALLLRYCCVLYMVWFMCSSYAIWEQEYHVRVITVKIVAKHVKRIDLHLVCLRKFVLMPDATTSFALLSFIW